MTLTIRQATIGDLDASHAIEIACFSPDEAADKTNMQTRLNLFPQGYLVAEIDEQLVGHINSGATNKNDISDEALKAMVGHDENGQHLVIFSVAVHPHYQHQGIASALLKAYIQHAPQMNKLSILLLCKENLVMFYAKFGFEDRGVSASRHGGAVWHEMCLPLKK